MRQQIYTIEAEENSDMRDRSNVFGESMSNSYVGSGDSLELKRDVLTCDGDVKRKIDQVCERFVKSSRVVVIYVIAV